MKNRDKFLTKSGIKVERNRTIDSMADSPNRDETLSPSPDLKNKKDREADVAHSSDMLASRLAERKEERKTVHSHTANAPRTTKPKQKAPTPINIQKINANDQVGNESSPSPK